MVLHGIAWYCMVLHGIVLYLTVLHGITLLASARGLYLARHLSILFYSTMTIKIVIFCSSFPKSLKLFPKVTLLLSNPLPDMLPYVILNPDGHVNPNDVLVRITFVTNVMVKSVLIFV